MNQVGKTDAEQVDCNLLGLNSEKMNKFKKNFYKLYSHQVECPEKCGMNECGMGSTCGNCPGSTNITRPGAIPDVNALGYLALNDNNKKPCVTCTQ